jgi:hypothetical protein
MTHMQFVEHLARAYPHLVHAITHPRNVQQWREWEAQAIAARPAPMPEPRLRRFANREPGLVLIAMLAIASVLLFFTAPKTPDRPVPGAPPAASAATSAPFQSATKPASSTPSRRVQ